MGLFSGKFFLATSHSLPHTFPLGVESLFVPLVLVENPVYEMSPWTLRTITVHGKSESPRRRAL